MSKFLAKADEIRQRLLPFIEQAKARIERRQLGLDSCQIEAYHDIVMDMELLFFSDSPHHPLYLKLQEMEADRKGPIPSERRQPMPEHIVQLGVLIDKYSRFRKELGRVD